MPRYPQGTRWSAGLLILTLATLPGCGGKTKETSPATSPAVEKADAPQPDKGPTKLFADWPPNPSGVLIVSGESNGYLQPCGCTGGQLGGFERRYDLFEKLHAQNWPTAAIDLGNIVLNPSSTRGGIEQEKIKFGIALKGLTAMKYDAVALAPEDLKLGVDEVLAQLLNLKEPPRFLSANLIPTAGMEDAVRKSTIAKAGDVTIGVTAVMSPESFNKLVDPARDALLTLKTPEEVLPAVLADLEKTSQIQVLMVQGPRDDGLKLAKQFPGFDVVVTTAKLPEPTEKPEYANDGKTLIVDAGQKGKYIVALGLYPGNPMKIQYSRFGLNSRLKNAEPMRVLIDEEYQSILKSVGLVTNFNRKANVEGAPGATYVGAYNCKVCHPNTFQKWSNSKHSHAYEGLTSNPKRNREFDAECISCHTTGFGYNTGWVSAELTSHLKGNQCENCHGPASRHVAEPDNKDITKYLKRTAEGADKGGMCWKCHDEDNSPNFNFQKYYAQIFHKGLDTYEDPRTHKGITPKNAPAVEDASKASEKTTTAPAAGAGVGTPAALR